MKKEEIAEEVWIKLFGWKVGDKCAVKLKTKIAYATITRLIEVTAIPYTKEIPSAIVEYETKSPIPRRQVIPLDLLLRDDRND